MKAVCRQNECYLNVKLHIYMCTAHEYVQSLNCLAKIYNPFFAKQLTFLDFITILTVSCEINAILLGKMFIDIKDMKCRLKSTYMCVLHIFLCNTYDCFAKS